VARSADEAAAQAAGEPVNPVEAFFENDELAAELLEEGDAQDENIDAPSAPEDGTGEERLPNA
jgi:hypothetical protein